MLNDFDLRLNGPDTTAILNGKMLMSSIDWKPHHLLNFSMHRTRMTEYVEKEKKSYFSFVNFLQDDYYQLNDILGGVKKYFTDYVEFKTFQKK